MLSNIEKIIFIVIAIGALGLSSVTFGKMFKAISVGSNPIDWKKALLNFPKGLQVFISQRTLFKTRPVIGLIHTLVAWGFTLYLIVNVVDVLYGFIPGFHFFPNHLHFSHVGLASPCYAAWAPCPEWYMQYHVIAPLFLCRHL